MTDVYVYICVARYANDFINTWIFKSIESAMKNYFWIRNNHIVFHEEIVWSSGDVDAFVKGESTMLRFKTNAGFECSLRKEKVTD